MNPEEARLILQCRRAQGQDDSLPAMAEAWEAIELHPEIRANLAADAEIDALIGQKLRSFAPPAELRSVILTGAKVTPMLPWWHRRTFLLSAAAVVVLGFFSLLLKSNLHLDGKETTWTGPLAGLQNFLEDTTARLKEENINFALASDKSGELQTYLAAHLKSPVAAIPASLSPLLTYGCEIFQWKGHEVTLMCFETEDEGTVHLFTINEKDLPGNFSGPLLASANGYETITWKQDGKIMQLAGHTTHENLRKLAANS